MAATPVGRYALLLSRIVLILASTRRLALAGRFVDFPCHATVRRCWRGIRWDVREDMKPATSGSANSEKALRPITLGIDLLAYLDQAKRRRFLKDWNDALRER